MTTPARKVESEEPEELRWGVGIAKGSLKEDAACRSVREEGYAAFYQKIRVTTKRGGKTVKVDRPFMSKYFYVGAKPTQGFHEASKADHVSTLLHNAEGFRTVSAGVMAEQMALVDADGYVPPEKLPGYRAPAAGYQHGQEVEIISGMWIGLRGIVEALAKRKGVCISSLRTVDGRRLVAAGSDKVWVPESDIRPVSGAPARANRARRIA